MSLSQFLAAKSNLTMVKLKNSVFILALFGKLAFFQGGLNAQIMPGSKLDIETRAKELLKQNANTVRFMENKGQIPNPKILYYFESQWGSVYLEKDRLVFVANKDTVIPFSFNFADLEDMVVLEPQTITVAQHVFSMRFEGADLRAVESAGNFGTRYNYIFGNDKDKWYTGVRASKELFLRDLYPGIDLRLYSTADGGLEFDWIIEKAADFERVKMKFTGQDSLSVDSEGNLEVALRFGKVNFNIPESYQWVDDQKHLVDANFIAENDGTVKFGINRLIDPDAPLVIDPTLVWGTLMDANHATFDQYLYAIQFDTLDGITYCAGATNREIPTNSPPYDADGYMNTVSGLTSAPPNGSRFITVLYRINNVGNDLLDLTLFGPSNMGTDGNQTRAHGLSLSRNRVFICGYTTVDIPLAGNPFDSTRSSSDGYVAVFSKNLSDLLYSTYIGGTGAEADRGGVSIRALSDTSFILGANANAALPSNYITSGAYDNTFAGTSEMYIAKFRPLRSIDWGTYVGGSAADILNDIEVFPDGKVAFCGWTTSTMTEVNSAAARSTGTDNDGLIGVLNASGTGVNYLDEIGGSGADRIQDLDIVDTTLYWTGDVSSGFPLGTGPHFDNTHNGGTDAIIGKVASTGGSSTYKATFYGTGTNDLGNGIKLVAESDCVGEGNRFILIWGTVNGTGLPVRNIGSDPFYDATHNGGVDMMFAGFTEGLDSLVYGTYVGGSANDYLGNIGDPRGSNHLWVNGSSIFVGTTTHSTTHTPNLYRNGFDQNKSNGTNDAHIIFLIEVTSIVEVDFGDCPLSFGTPSHGINCNLLGMRRIDSEPAHQPHNRARGDDLNKTDDEDAVGTIPGLLNGGPQTITVTIDSIFNQTGKKAYIYAWINLNGNTRFNAPEFVLDSVPTGFVGSRTLTWSNVTVTRVDSTSFMRIRITTDSLIDNQLNDDVDERSIVLARDGEVEDYWLDTIQSGFMLTCPANVTEAACQTQATINTKFTDWLNTAMVTGGCSPGLSNNNTGAPSACGGSTTVTFTATSGCDATLTCSASFTVTAAPAVVLTCPVNQTEAACQTQAQINSKFTTWLNTASFSGGCNAAISNNNTGAPSACGGSTTVTWTVTSTCEPNKTCSAVFTVTAAPAVVLNCPVNQTEAACQTQTQINSKFTAWLNTASFSGGCNAAISNNNTGAPLACGGSTTVTWTVTSTCEPNKTCSAVFTVTTAPPVVLNCPANTTLASCHTQAYVDSSYNAWLNSVTFSGGCNAQISNNSTGPPDRCGGSKTVIFTVTSTCEANKTCSAFFRVDSAANVVLTCPPNSVETGCHSQDTINARYQRWLESVMVSGGCNVNITNNSTGAPDRCGGVKTVTFTVTSSCTSNKTCSASFRVDTNLAPLVTGTLDSILVEGCDTTDAPDPVSSVSGLEAMGVDISDDCQHDSTLVVEFNQNSSGSCPIIITRNYRIKDNCNNVTAEFSQIISIDDTTPPDVTGELDTLVVQGCTPEDAPPPVDNVADLEAFGIMVSDSCTPDSLLVVTSSDVANGNCPIVVTRSYRITDLCMNMTGDLIQIIIIEDTTRPHFTRPPDITIYKDHDCMFDSDTAITGDVTDEMDNCSVGLEATFVDSIVVGVCADETLIYRRWSLEDDCGNAAEDQIQLITVLDTILPSFSAPPDITIYKSPDIPDTATIVNYDFNGGSSFETLCPQLFTGIESKVDEDASNPFKQVSGVVTGSNAFIDNPIAANGLTVDTSNQLGRWQFQLTGESLPKCRDFKVYLQAFRNRTESAANLELEYSLDSLTWSNFSTTPLTVGAWQEINGDIPTIVANPDTLFIRITYSGGSGGGLSELHIDNFQVNAILCCGYDASPNVTGDVTDEMDNCSDGLVATFCDSTVTEPCIGSTVIYRTWMLKDSCGNMAPSQTQLITVSDTTPPFFIVPPDTTIYKGTAVPDTNVLVNYDFNRGQSYRKLVPKLYFGIESKVDTCSNAFLTDTGTVTGPLAFVANNVAGRALRVDTSDRQGHWQFNIRGMFLPLCSNFEVYLQTLMKDTTAADTVHYEYSIDSIVFTRFKSVPLIHEQWVEDTAMIPNNLSGLTRLFIRFTYSGATGPDPAKLFIDNFQLRAFVDHGTCGWDASPDITGWPQDVMDNCDTIPTLAYIDSISVGSCPDEMIIERTWIVTDDCGNSSTGVQIITAIDTTRPEINCPADVTVNCEESTGTDTLGIATALDNCTDTILIVNHDDEIIPGTCPGDYVINRTWTVEDSCGNVATCLQVITVVPIPGPFLICPNDTTVAACLSQSEVDDLYDDWLRSVYIGGCNPVLSDNDTGPPNACGGAKTVIFTVTHDCGDPVTCEAVFTVTTAPQVSLACPVNQTEAACQTQAEIDQKFSDWLNTATFSGGCNAAISNNNTGAPSACGGSVTVTFTVTSSCEPAVSCVATFTVETAPAVVLTCPANRTEAACQTQAEIDQKFSDWLGEAMVSGGCNAMLSNSNSGTPDACGGVVSVTFTVTSSCEPAVSCVATFTVETAPAVVLTCPANRTEAACQTQAEIDQKFNDWLGEAMVSGGCNAMLSNSGGSAPDACGGVTSVTFTVTSSCEPAVSCVATFTVETAPAVVLTCPANRTEAACQTQAEIDQKFNDWLGEAMVSGGCNAMLSNSGGSAPDACGGVVSVTFTVTSSCEPAESCVATFTVETAPAVVLTCPANRTEAACQTQAEIDQKFNDWLGEAMVSGGCNAMLSNTNSGTPNACGGVVSVTFTVTSSCEPAVSCVATFTVETAPAVVLTCPANRTEAACQTQAEIDQKFNDWLGEAMVSGGCNAMLSNSGGSAPDACGGVVNVTFTVTSSCEPAVSCVATFTVEDSPLVLTCPANLTEAACQTQSQIDQKFSDWLNTVTYSGGCNVGISNNNTGAPPACGGSVTVTFTATSSCEANRTCTASFTVESSPLVLTCPANRTEAACQTQSQIDQKFSDWLNTVTYSGGCNVGISNNNAGAPLACGGSVTVTFTATSSCEANRTCTASFTVESSPLVLTCPANRTEAACQTQSQIDQKFSDWLNTVTYSGGCNVGISNNNTGAPSACGGSVTVTFTATSSCDANQTCSAVFTVSNSTPLSVSCASNTIEPPCLSQNEINVRFNNWLATTSAAGGCNVGISNDNTGAPNACGGSTTVIFTITSSCDATQTCSAVFTVTDAPAIVFNCPTNQTEAACQTQSEIDNKFNAWLLTANVSGGCNAGLSNNNTGAPSYCGGSTTVTFTVTSSCEAPRTCSASFTVTAPEPIVLNCPSSVTHAACLNQDEIDSLFNSWLLSATVTGGCNAALTNNNTGSPDRCGGSKTVTFTVTSSCEPTRTCFASFTIPAIPPPTIECPDSITIQCITEPHPTHTGWAVAVDGCNQAPLLTFSDDIIPGACDGERTILRTWTATDDCNQTEECVQVISVINNILPDFDVPADITITRKDFPASTHLLVNYNFNSGVTYESLSPFLAAGITSIVDSTSNVFNRTNGTTTGSLAFVTNAVAGKALKVNDSSIPGHWQFNIGGRNLSAYSNFEVYVQAYRNGDGSANNLIFEYSLDKVSWNNFSNTPLIKGQWVECLSGITGVSYPTNLYIRVRYSGGSNQQSRELFIDNFQIQAFRDSLNCSFDDSAPVTGYPTNITHPCTNDFSMTYSDSVHLGPCNQTKVYRTWVVTDACGNSSTGNSPQIISVHDSTGPVILCPPLQNNRKADTTVCYYTVNGKEFDPNAVDACGDSVTLVNNFNNSRTLAGEQIRVGYHTIRWTATDACGNTSTCTFNVNVFEAERPVARCKNFSVNLNPFGKYYLSPSEIDNGSTDNCGIKTRRISLDSVGCDDIPSRRLILTVIDSSGFSDTCSAIVTIRDTSKPVIVCKDITISIPPNGYKVITADSVLSHARDSCGIASMTVSPNTFDCKSNKTTTVTVVVTDVQGNSSTCTAKVTVSNLGDADCDGVKDACDVCPGADDSVDNNNDGLPDCKYPPPFARVLPAWKCGTNPNRVFVAEILSNGQCTTRCMSYTQFRNNQGPNLFLGPCKSCPPEFGIGDEILADGNFADDYSADSKDFGNIEFDFAIIPNPNYGLFDIIFSKGINQGVVEVYDLLGQMVWSYEITSRLKKLEVNSSAFTSHTTGVYRVRVRSYNHETIHSLIIVR